MHPRSSATPRRALLAAAIVLACAAAPAAAEGDAAPVDFDKVVVTASGFEQKITDAPASISVITREDLERKQFGNLAEAIGDVEGVDINQGTGKTGGLDISIRGMPSAYTLILIDGRRQNNSGDVTPNGFGDTSTSFMPPLSAIERIEVIRGPMSTLYGSDAMGGVVNIITRAVPSTWGGSVGASHTFNEDSGYGAATDANFYLAGPLASDRLGLAIRGNWYDRDASDLSFADGSVVSRRGAAAVEGENRNLGARLTFSPSEFQQFWLDVESGRQRYANDDCQLGTLDGYGGNATAGCTSPNNTAAGYSDELRFERDQAVLSHRGQFGFGLWETALTRKVTETTGRTIPGVIGGIWDNFPNHVGGAPRLLESSELILDTKLVLPLGENHMLTVGGQYLDSEVEDGIATEVFQRDSWSLFVEDEWRLLENVGLTFGGRYENHDAFGGHFSPRAYLSWGVSDHWTIKGGVSHGYRVPTVNQLHDGISGVSGQGRTLTIGSPHLKPETSENYEIGFYYDTLDGFNANLTVFHTEFDDMISGGTPIPNCHSETSPNLPGCLDYGDNFTQDSFGQSTNIGSASSQGAELAARWEFAPAWSVAGNYTWTRTEQKSGTDRGAAFTNQPRHIANASLNWEATESLDLWLRGEYYSARDRFTSLYENLTPADRAVVDGLGQLRSYSQFHLGGAYRVNDNLTVNATIYNLLDKDFLEGTTYLSNTGQEVWGSYYTQISRSVTGTIQEGRRLWLSVNVTF